MRRIDRDNKGTMRPGQDLVVAGYAGLMGTIEAVAYKKEELLHKFSRSYVNNILEQEPNILKMNTFKWNLEQWRELGATECEPVTEGGILTALWNLSGAYMTGIEFALRQIPVKQETIEVCEFFDLNPYRLKSDGCFLLVADNGNDLVTALRDQGIDSAVIGKVRDGIKRIINHGESVGYLDRPTEDELHKIIL